MYNFFETPLTVALQAYLSTRFPRQKYWSGLPFPSPGIFPTQGSNPHLLHWQADSLPLSHQIRPSTCSTPDFLVQRNIGHDFRMTFPFFMLLSGRSPGGGNGKPLQYFCLENPINRGAWPATVHGVTKSQT